MYKFTQLLKAVRQAAASFYPFGAARIVPTAPRRSSSFKPNGTQEMARRRRQIERGQLNMCNGLLYVATGGRWAADSHGRACKFCG